jgi:hypothetical protein
MPSPPFPAPFELDAFAEPDEAAAAWGWVLFMFLCATMVSLNSRKSPREDSRSKASPLSESAS